MRRTEALAYENLTGRWFYFPVGSQYLSKKPALLSFGKGFMLSGSRISSIICTTDTFEMIDTNADAVLADYFFLPGAKKLGKQVTACGRPVIVSLRAKASRLPVLAGKYQKTGVSAIYTGHRVTADSIKKICSECSIPVISETDCDPQEIIAKIKAGAYAISIPGQNISDEIIAGIHDIFPHVPVIAKCKRNIQVMNNCSESDIDAIIYRPCVPYEWDFQYKYMIRLYRNPEYE